MNTKPIFITGIGTGVGKTIVSAVICEQLKADYWKPVQAGDLFHTDSDKVWELISNSKTKIYNETFKLRLPASPHQAARLENIEIKAEDFKLPNMNRNIVVEGAGGLFVPLSDSFYMIDLIRKLDAEVVLVSRSYLGCINHTLLSLHALKSLGIRLKHFVFNGNFNEDSQRVILNQLPEESTWSKLPEFGSLNKLSVLQAPNQIPF